MLCCALLLHFGDQTSCYVAQFCSTMVPKVLAHIDAIDNGWKACKNMLPSSFPSHTPMIMTHDICQSLAYIEKLMCVTTLQDGPQVELMEWNRWRCRETHQHAKKATFFEGVQHAFLNSHCDKTIIFQYFS